MIWSSQSRTKYVVRVIHLCACDKENQSISRYAIAYDYRDLAMIHVTHFKFNRPEAKFNGDMSSDSGFEY